MVGVNTFPLCVSSLVSTTICICGHCQCLLMGQSVGRSSASILKTFVSISLFTPRVAV